MSRKEEVTLSRLKTGHSHITHSYLLKKKRGPILHTMLETVYNQTHSNRMYWLKTNTTKILPNNKLKTNFLPEKS